MVTAHDTAPVLVTCMKDEGIFLLEWVAYHRAIGFDAVVVNTNNCTDGTDAICDRLAELGLIEHVENVVPEGGNPQATAMARLLARKDIRARDWLLHIDADEFLAVSAGEGRVADLIDTIPPDADVVALHWRSFGNGEALEWEPGNVVETWTRTTAKPTLRLERHKSMFRPARFRAAIDHMPKEPVSLPVTVVNSAGAAMPSKSISHPTRAAYRAGYALATWENACIHHYALKTQDVFRLKGVRGHGTGASNPKYEIGGKFWRRNRGRGMTDLTALRHLEEMKGILADMRGDARIAELESAARDWFLDRRKAMYERDRAAAAAEAGNG